MSFRESLLATICIIAFSSSAAVLADKSGDDPARLLAKYDSNGDNAISLVEVEEKRKRIFGAMDHDSNGGVSFSEYEKQDTDRRSALLKARFDKLDLDRNGQLSGEEYASYLGSFDRLDRNSDGQISQAEMIDTRKEAEAKQSKPRREADHCVLWFCVRKDAF